MALKKLSHIGNPFARVRIKEMLSVCLVCFQLGLRACIAKKKKKRIKSILFISQDLQQKKMNKALPSACGNHTNRLGRENTVPELND